MTSKGVCALLVYFFSLCLKDHVYLFQFEDSIVANAVHMQLLLEVDVVVNPILNSLGLSCFIEHLKQINKALFMVIANHKLAAAFRRRNTSSFRLRISGALIIKTD